MPKKRKSGGRGKGGKGRGKSVQCSSCGRLVAEDKCKKVTRRVSFIEPTLARELRAKGAYIPEHTEIKYYCISCASHRGIASPRQKEKRKDDGIKKHVEWKMKSEEDDRNKGQ